MSTVIKPKSSQSETVETLPVGKEPLSQETVQVDVPYSDYQQHTGHPLVADVYNLGDYYEAYSKELNNLDLYIQAKIDKGEIANSQQAVRDLLKHIEKVNNLRNEERPAVKLGILSSYVRFMLDSEEVKHNAVKYGN